MTEALKFDAGKEPLHLIDPLWLTTTARVLDFGQKKYAAWNWAIGTFAYSRMYAALQRHMQAWWAGEENDPETGMPHIWHANCCMMFLTRYTHDGMGVDDRPTFPFTPGGSPADQTQVPLPDWNELAKGLKPKRGRPRKNISPDPRPPYAEPWVPSRVRPRKKHRVRQRV